MTEKFPEKLRNLEKRYKANGITGTDIDTFETQLVSLHNQLQNTNLQQSQHEALDQAQYQELHQFFDRLLNTTDLSPAHREDMYKVVHSALAQMDQEPSNLGTKPDYSSFQVQQQLRRQLEYAMQMRGFNDEMIRQFKQDHYKQEELEQAQIDSKNTAKNLFQGFDDETTQDLESRVYQLNYNPAGAIGKYFAQLLVKMVKYSAHLAAPEAVVEPKPQTKQTDQQKLIPIAG